MYADSCTDYSFCCLCFRKFLLHKNNLNFRNVIYLYLQLNVKKRKIIFYLYKWKSLFIATSLSPCVSTLIIHSSPSTWNDYDPIYLLHCVDHEEKNKSVSILKADRGGRKSSNFNNQACDEYVWGLQHYSVRLWGFKWHDQVNHLHLWQQAYVGKESERRASCFNSPISRILFVCLYVCTMLNGLCTEYDFAAFFSEYHVFYSDSTGSCPYNPNQVYLHPKGYFCSYQQVCGNDCN